MDRAPIMQGRAGVRKRTAAGGLPPSFRIFGPGQLRGAIQFRGEAVALAANEGEVLERADRDDAVEMPDVFVLQHQGLTRGVVANGKRLCIAASRHALKRQRCRQVSNLFLSAVIPERERQGKLIEQRACCGAAVKDALYGLGTEATAVGMDLPQFPVLFAFLSIQRSAAPR